MRKNISNKIDNGTIVHTRDSHLNKNGYDKPDKKGLYRMTVVVDSNKKDELALVKLTTSKKGTPLPNYKNGKSKYKNFIETKDKNGKPIKLTKAKKNDNEVAFVKGSKTKNMSKADANNIKINCIKDKKTGKQNRKKSKEQLMANKRIQKTNKSNKENKAIAVLLFMVMFTGLLVGVFAGATNGFTTKIGADVILTSEHEQLQSTALEELAIAHADQVEDFESEISALENDIDDLEIEVIDAYQNGKDWAPATLRYDADQPDCQALYMNINASAEDIERLVENGDLVIEIHTSEDQTWFIEVEKDQSETIIEKRVLIQDQNPIYSIVYRSDFGFALDIQNNPDAELFNAQTQWDVSYSVTKSCSDQVFNRVFASEPF